jgi:3-oxoacyl-[acyl-carrier-protein] synthase-1/3-oxoacyl-[acyl-carrier-protein] synthase II
MEDHDQPPEAVVLGGTTGGIATTEELMRQGNTEPEAYRWHGVTTMAEEVANHVACRGPAYSVATACSSGAVALLLAAAMLRRGEAQFVLAGGVDGLCRLTYCGFNALRLIDPTGAKPFDDSRAGMTVGEGAALLLLQAAATAPDGALAEIRGGGLSCDAYHPSSPDPEGKGAFMAMEAALAEAKLAPEDISYCCLHGTGTADNDRAEALALRKLFAQQALPALSSVKGALGHTVGASGAVQAAVATLALADGFVPANVGGTTPEAALGITPAPEPLLDHPVQAVLANAFGFGGNNAALVLAPPLGPPRREQTGGRRSSRRVPRSWTIIEAACLTGAGGTAASIAALEAGKSLAGLVPEEEFTRHLPRSRLRRLKRLPRLALALAAEVRAAHDEAKGQGREGGGDEGDESVAHAVVTGTSWGALSETHDFLAHLYETEEKFGSPTDFVGTVHNAPAGQIAQWLEAREANITASSGATSFEDALYLASLVTAGNEDRALFVAGFDEGHHKLSPLVDRATSVDSLSDGGGAFLLKPARPRDTGPSISLVFRGTTGEKRAVARALEALGGADKLESDGPALWFGYPADQQEQGERQLAQLRERLGEEQEFFNYREALGEYATVPAAAAALAAAWLRQGDGAASPQPPDSASTGRRRSRRPGSVVVVSLGEKISVLRITGGRSNGGTDPALIDQTRIAYRLFKQRRYDEAEAIFRDVLAQEAANAYALVGLGDCCRKTKDFRQALALYEECLATAPDNRYAQFGRADCLHQQRRHRDAAAAWDTYLEHDPDNPLVLTRAADAHRKAGNLSRAKQLYETVLTIDEKNPYALTGMGFACSDDQDFSRAATYWQRLYDLNPDKADVRVLTCLGNSYRRLKRFRQAERYFRQALEQEQNNGYALFGLADCCRGRHHMDAAIEVWERLLAQEPANIAVLTRLGDAYRRCRREDLAEERYRQALQHSPNDAFALLGMAQLELHRQRPAQALSYAEQLLEKRAPHYRAYLVAIDCLVDLGQFDRAQTVLAQARRQGVRHRALDAKEAALDRDRRRGGSKTNL